MINHQSLMASKSVILTNKFDTKELLESYVASCIRYHNRMNDEPMVISEAYSTENAKVVDMSWIADGTHITNHCVWIISA